MIAPPIRLSVVGAGGANQSFRALNHESFGLLTTSNGLFPPNVHFQCLPEGYVGFVHAGGRENAVIVERKLPGEILDEAAVREAPFSDIGKLILIRIQLGAIFINSFISLESLGPKLFE